jgi:hypothetical protein
MGASGGRSASLVYPFCVSFDVRAEGEVGLRSFAASLNGPEGSRVSIAISSSQQVLVYDVPSIVVEDPFSCFGGSVTLILGMVSAMLTWQEATWIPGRCVDDTWVYLSRLYISIQDRIVSEQCAYCAITVKYIRRERSVRCCCGALRMFTPLLLCYR